MYDLATPDLHHDEHIEDTEAKCHRDHEITGYDGLGMVSHKSHPALGGRPSPRISIFGPIGAHGSWGYEDAKLESQF
jgi:hypothetical protein